MLHIKSLFPIPNTVYSIQSHHHRNPKSLPQSISMLLLTSNNAKVFRVFAWLLVWYFRKSRDYLNWHDFACISLRLKLFRAEIFLILCLWLSESFDTQVGTTSVHDFRAVNIVERVYFLWTFFSLYPSILQVQHSVIHINPPDTIWNTNSHKTTCTITTCIAFTMMLSFRHHQSGTQKTCIFPFSVSLHLQPTINLDNLKWW